LVMPKKNQQLNNLILLSLKNRMKKMKKLFQKLQLRKILQLRNQPQRKLLPKPLQRIRVKMTRKKKNPKIKKKLKSLERKRRKQDQA
jgi:hypothetical protein